MFTDSSFGMVKVPKAILHPQPGAPGAQSARNPHVASHQQVNNSSADPRGGSKNGHTLRLWNNSAGLTGFSAGAKSSRGSFAAKAKGNVIACAMKVEHTSAVGPFPYSFSNIAPTQLQVGLLAL